MKRHGKRKGTLINTSRIVDHRPAPPKRINGWIRIGPFWVPDKRAKK